MNQKDAHFKRVHTVMDNISRQLHKEGVGTDKIQACVVTDTEENHLWETGIVGTHSPTALQNAVFFYYYSIISLIQLQKNYVHVLMIITQSGQTGLY